MLGEHHELPPVDRVGRAAIPPPDSLLTTNDNDDQYDHGPPADLDLQEEVAVITMSPSLEGFDGEVPHTQKQYNIMEKTTLFLATQSAQMVIMLRAKQHRTPWMQFLEPSHRLNPLYQALRTTIAADNSQPGAIPEPPPSATTSQSP
jgi:hypothetical protein